MPDASGTPQLPSQWRDHRDAGVDRPPPPGPDAPAFYLPLMEFQGADYDRNAFTKGTAAEVSALVERLGLVAGTSILDVGCGTGRHLRALAADPGCVGLGVDASPALVEVANAAAAAAAAAGVGEGHRRVSFVVGDGRDLAAVPQLDPWRADGTDGTDDTGGTDGTDGTDGFDVAWTLCQGAFGTHPETDAAVVEGLAQAVRPGGTVVLTAFHALFAARHLVEGDAYDVVHGVHHQRTEVRGPDHARRTFDLWTAAYTAGEVVRTCADAGLVVDEVVGCEPGRYDSTELRLDDPELLVVAHRPAG